MSLHEDLLKQAESLTELDKGKPKQANLRRAISAAYYGLFHFLIDQACRQALGTRQSMLSYRRILARAFDHGGMRSACDAFAKGHFPRGILRSLPTGFTVPAELQDIARSFVDLQEHRHQSDYDLNASFRRSDARSLVEQAEVAVQQFDQLPEDPVRGFFLACLMTWKNLGGRP